MLHRIIFSASHCLTLLEFTVTWCDGFVRGWWRCYMTEAKGREKIKFKNYKVNMGWLAGKFWTRSACMTEQFNFVLILCHPWSNFDDISCTNISWIHKKFVFIFWQRHRDNAAIAWSRILLWIISAVHRNESTKPTIHAVKIL